MLAPAPKWLSFEFAAVCCIPTKPTYKNDGIKVAARLVGVSRDHRQGLLEKAQACGAVCGVSVPTAQRRERSCQGLTPRQAISLLAFCPENLTKEPLHALCEVRHLNSEIERVMEVVDSFVSMLRTLQGQHLDKWMKKALQSEVGEIRTFVEKLRKDQDEVQAGMTLHWNNGVVEGQ